MKLKRTVSAIMALSMLVSGIVVYQNTPNYTFTAVAASSIDSFLESGTDFERASIITDGASNTFSMNGYVFNYGIVFNDGNITGQVCYNVENVDSLSFTIGHVDNSGGSNAKLSFYLDDKEYDTVDLHWTMDLQEYQLDVSKASTLRIVLTKSGSCSYALGDFKSDSYDQGKEHIVPEYASSQEFLESGFAIERLSIADPSTKSPTYYMNGRGFYEGVLFNDGNITGQVCYNVENVHSLSFTIGHVDNSGGSNAKLSFYLDDKEYDTVDLHWTMDLQEYQLDVSKASTLRIVLTKSGSCSYALGDFKSDSYDQGKEHIVPEYESSQEFLESGFAIERLSIADPSTKSPTYYMNGRGFYEGVLFNDGNITGQVCYNVENVDSLSFTIGHVDNSGSGNANLTVYLDDKKYDTIALTSDMSLLSYTIDTSKSSVLRIVLDKSGSCSYALGDVSIVISDDEGSVYGDCNNDGSFNVADVVLLQKWLLAVPDAHLENWKAADLCEDDRLDVFDLCLMKRKLVND